MRYILYTLALTLSVSANAQTGIPVPQMTSADNLVKNFMTTYGVNGLSIAMAKDGKIVYSRGFGYQNLSKTIAVQPHNLFRIASCSKQITAIAIMKLLQEGKLSMSSKVFGPGAILEDAPVISTSTISDTRVYNMTVQQLLEHTAGWDRSVNCNPSPTPPYPYYFAGCDPIDNPLTVSMTLGTSNPVSENYLVKYLLQKGLNFDPGTKYAYSNIGYLALGAIIEELSGMSYAEYVKTQILAPLGIFDMQIGNNLLSEKQEREVEYVNTGGYTNLSVYGTGQQLPWTYGGMNVHAMSAHGGWITTASDFVKLVAAVDGFATKPDILTPATISVMTTPSSVNANYAKGWQVNIYNNWWHTGSIPGTASEVVRSGNGYIWFIITNSSLSGSAFTALDNLGWNIVSSVSTWPTWDLMLAPTQNASNLNFTNLTPTSVTVNWTNGNGSSRLLLIKADGAVDSFPLDGTNYAANADYGAAPVLGGGVRVVYNGSGNTVNVTGLEAGKNYYFRVVEFNNSTETGNNSLYVLGDNPVGMATPGAVPVKLISFNGTYSDNAANLRWKTANEINSSTFIIERSEDGTRFEEVGKVAASGNTSTTHSYSYTDRLNGSFPPKLFYRLKMTDKDGSFEYSPVITLNTSSRQTFSLTPNPTSSWVNIKGEDMARVQITDLAGRILLSKAINQREETLNVSTLQNGTYILRVTNKEGISQTQKLLIKK